MGKSSLALFDFDGTITTKDTLIAFIRFTVGECRFFTGILALSPMLFAYKLNLISNDVAKEKMLSFYFKGMKKEKFLSFARAYANKHLDNIIRPQALACIQRHLKNGDTVVVVSASIECWLKPWCNRYGIHLVSTKLASSNGVLNGKFLTKNCYGKEKVKRIKEQYCLQEYNIIYAYGDSRGDKELLALADKSYYRPFRK